MATAVMWAFGATLFGMAAKRTSSVLVNAIRLPLGALLLWLSFVIVSGEVWPAHISARQHFWLGLSGVLGLAIGDSFYYLSITMIGPRRASLMMPATPVIASVAAWSLLAENLDLMAILGISIVIVGILIAVLGRDRGTGEFADLPRRVLWRGLAAAGICAICSGLGNVFAKLGMAGGLEPLPAATIRGFWATAGMLIFLIGRPSVFRDLGGLLDRRVIRIVLIAVVIGPFLGMWAAVTSLSLAKTGISTVLMNIVPITVLLPAWIFYRDKPSPLAFFGTLVAVGGGALLFIR